MTDLGNVITMFTDETENDSQSEEAILTRPSRGHTIILTGTMDGATVTILIKASNGIFVPIGGGTLTEVGSVFLEGSSSSMTIKALLEGVGGSTEISLEVTK